MGIRSEIINQCLEHVPKTSDVTLHVDKFPFERVHALKRSYERLGFTLRKENDKEIESIFQCM